MSKPIEHVLLIPGEEAWEVWSGTGEAGYGLLQTLANGLADEARAPFVPLQR